MVKQLTLTMPKLLQTWERHFFAVYIFVVAVIAELGNALL